MAFISSLFSITPRVIKRNSALVAMTALQWQILTMGCFRREITVSPRRKDVVIENRYLWIFHSRRQILFTKIEGVNYEYADLNVLGSWFASSYDSADCYSVSLRLRSGDTLHLFDFMGDGSFHNHGPWPDWMYWGDFAFDVTGTQQQESLAYAELLKQMIGVPFA